jgi:lipopolysaccharide transport system ATP-binding protein
MGKNIAIKVENLSKAYQLGQIGTGTISRDLERFWTTKIRGKEDPFLKIGQTNDRTVKGESDIVWSLKDINFEIEQGDAVGIIGRNGAGKSTLLKLLSRVTAPTTGKIKVKGRIASLLEVGTGFHPELTGRENIFLNGAILGMRKREIIRKLDEIVDFSGVERYIDTPVKRYSSGMYVRLAFAVAAHLESEILIVDEVLAVGDAEFQKKCLGKMGDISKGQGRTVLFVSHNMGAIKNLCNTGLCLFNGELSYLGNIHDSVSRHINQSDFKSRHKSDFINVKNLPVFIERVELIVNGKKSVNCELDFQDIIGFEIKLRVNKEVKNRGIVIHCNDEYDRLFSVFDISKFPNFFEGRQIGIYNVKVMLKHPIFCEGNYSFDFEVGHFGNEIEQYENNAINIAVSVLSRNPRFEPAIKSRNNRVFVEPEWIFDEISHEK